MQYLAAASDLSVANAAFCTDVKSFGDIKEFENYRFQPGQEVLLYCEVDNFVSAPLPNGTNHETHLRGSYKITDTSGYPVDEQALPANQDVSQTPRRDYFMVYRIWLPQTIAAGKYELNLAIEDINGRKFGNQVIDFEIAQ
jgi:hypothetical protein